MPKDLPRNWAEVGKALQKVPRPALTKLIKELYDTQPNVRNFLHARFAPVAGPDPKVLKSYRDKIHNLFPHNDFYATPPFTDARNVARDYEKAAVDPLGATSLLIEAIQLGLDIVAHGDPGNRFVDGLSATLRLLHKKLSAPAGRELARDLEPQIRALASPASKCGYGLCDNIPPWIDEILTDLPPKPSPPKRYDGDPDFDSV